MEHRPVNLVASQEWGDKFSDRQKAVHLCLEEFVRAACYAGRSLDRRVCDVLFFLSPLLAWCDKRLAQADVFIVTRCCHD